MPQIGEIKKGKEIGSSGVYGKFQWCACVDCGKERWVHIVRKKPVSLYCQPCAIRHLLSTQSMEKSPSWKGGRRRTSAGYIQIKLSKDDFFFRMAPKCGYVMEHRLVMAKHLGRCLQHWELVHHKNGIKDDNKIGNLILSTNGAHIADHCRGYRDGYQKGLYDGHEARIKQLEARVILLEAENTLLKTDKFISIG